MKQKGLWLAAGLVVAVASAWVVSAADDLRLVDAAQRRDTVAVRALLAQHVNVNASQPDGATALAWAAHWDDLELADALIKAGANVNAANQLAVTPLMLAALNGNAAMVDKLLSAGADSKVARPSGETPLMMAAHSGSAAAVKTLVAHGADVNARAKSGDTALMFAAAEGHVDAARALVEGGADVQARAETKGGKSRSMMRAAAAADAPKDVKPASADKAAPNVGGDNRDVAKQARLEADQKGEGFRLLYKNQAVAIAQIPKDGDKDPPKPEGGFTPLLHASMAGSKEIVALLLKAGAKINDAASDGMTPLIVAIDKHHEDVAILLLEHGADPNLNEAGFTALHAAAATGEVEVVKALLAHKADPNARLTMPLRLSSAFIPYNPELVAGRLSQVGATPFMLAAKSVDTRMMKLLVEGGANPLLKANDGTTAIILAAGLGKRSATDMFKFIRYYTWDEDRAIETIKLCLDLGLDINAANDVGETALHGATYHSALKVIKFLVEKGANINAANWAGQTPYRLAQGHFYSGTFVRYPESVELLRKLGADPEAGVTLNFGLTQYASDVNKAGVAANGGTTDQAK